MLRFPGYTLEATRYQKFRIQGDIMTVKKGPTGAVPSR